MLCYTIRPYIFKIIKKNNKKNKKKKLKFPLLPLTHPL